MVKQHDAAALLLELAAAAATAAALKAATTTLLRWVTAQWGVVFGVVHGKQAGPRLDGLVRDLTRRVRALPAPDMDAAAEYARRARILGVVQGYREADFQIPAAWIAHPERVTAEQMLTDLETAGAPEELLREARRGLDSGTRSRLSKGRRDALERLDRAATQVHELAEASLADVMKALAPAQTAGNFTDTTARGIAVEQLNEGILAAARALGVRVFWVTERDANVCAACQSLNGQFPDFEGLFRPEPDDRGRVPYRLDANGDKIPLTVPPLHGQCRCRLSLWNSRRPPRHDDLPKLLQREARERLRTERGVVESALEPTPASQLLTLVATRSRSKRGRTVPRAVIERARRTLRASTRRRTGR